MGFNVGIESDLLFIKGKYPDFIYLNRKHIDRLYFQFTEQYKYELELSVLGQLDKLLEFEICFLGKLYPWEGEEIIPEDYWINIDKSIQNIKMLVIKLEDPTELMNRIEIPNKELEANTNYYINYVKQGKFKRDLLDVLNNLENHKKAGATRVFFEYG